MSQPLHDTSPSTHASDREAGRLYAEYGDRIFRYCVGQLRSREEAEDAVQNTFLRVTTAMRKGVVPEFEAPWLYKIAHNVCLSRRLGSSRRARVETPADIDALGDRAAAYTADADELFGLDDALAGMPPNLRRPLLMREWQGMSYAEIAEALGVSHSAVETLIFRGRRHLAQALGDSAKKSGRAIATILPIRPLVAWLRGLGSAGAGGAGLAAGTAALVVAVGGGVAIDLATQPAQASHARLASAATGAKAVVAESPGRTSSAQVAAGGRGKASVTAGTAHSSAVGGRSGSTSGGSAPATTGAARTAPGPSGQGDEHRIGRRSGIRRPRDRLVVGPASHRRPVQGSRELVEARCGRTVQKAGKVRRLGADPAGPVGAQSGKRHTARDRAGNTGRAVGNPAVGVAAGPAARANPHAADDRRARQSRRRGDRPSRRRRRLHGDRDRRPGRH